MTAAETLARLGRLRAAGTLRALDLAFARFLHELDPGVPGSLLSAAALLAQLEGAGHSCLPLADFLRDAPALLAWPAEAGAELAQELATWPADAAAARRAWGGSSVLEVDPADEGGSTPLVLCGQRLYLRRYWRYETQVAAQLRARTGPAAGPPPDPAPVRALLDRLFGPPGAEPDEQKLACALALRSRFAIVTGGPGTGKTWTAARLLVLAQALHTGAQPLRVALAAPTGKAAARLRQSIDAALQGLRAPLAGSVPLDDWAAHLGPARTLHALLGTRPGTRRFVHDAAEPLDLDLLFVDEASMVHLELMAALLDALPARARLVLLGDKDQLASVEAGAVLGELCQGTDAGPGHHAHDSAALHWLRAATGEALPDAAAVPCDGPLAPHTATLHRSRRFEGPIGRLAQALNAGDGAGALALLRAPPDDTVAMLVARDAQAVTGLALKGRAGANGAADGAVGGYRNYLQALARRPADPAAFEAWAHELLGRYDEFRVLCALRAGPWGVAGLNAAIESALAAQGLLHKRGEWYEGRPVMVTRNDAALGVFNGDVGLVLQPPGPGGLRACFADGAALRTVSVARLADVQTAYAMTVHKSQGSEFAHVVLVLPDADSAVLTRELVYTGVTRARRALTVVADDPARLALASTRLTQRLSGLQALLRQPVPGPSPKYPA